MQTPDYQARREWVFLALAGVFISAMTLLNVIGITRFVSLGDIFGWPIVVAVGVLPYPITFLCTDLISEIFGRRRANQLVTVGLGLNVFILAVMWLAQSLPAPEVTAPWQWLQLAEPVALPSGGQTALTVELFEIMFAMTSGAVFASMMAYLLAQYVDVQLFHFWKKLTKGKHLWLRNNCSTLVSQMVDAFVVIAVTFGASYLAGNVSLSVLLGMMAANYLFKVLAALFDTPFFYLLTHFLRRYLNIPLKIDE